MKEYVESPNMKVVKLANIRSVSDIYAVYKVGWYRAHMTREASVK